MTQMVTVPVRHPEALPFQIHFLTIFLAQLKALLATHILKKENRMLPSIRSILKRSPLKAMASAFVVIALTFLPLMAAADEDPCRTKGIYILNQTQLDSWFTRNEGACTFWAHHYLITIKPGDALILYRDMECKTEYYSKTPTYDDYKSLDANGDCRVRILFDRTLSDL